MRRHAVFAFVLFLLGSPAASAQSGGFDRAAFEAYVETLGGTMAPRFYGYTGTVYDVPSGKIIATVDGYQLARVFRNTVDPNQAVLVRRAFLLYRAVGSGEVISHYPDVRAKSMPKPPLGLVRLKLEGDRATTRAVVSNSGLPTNITLPEQLSAAREGGDYVFRRVLSPPDPQQQPIEVTEMVLRPSGLPSERIRIVMTKVANNQSFLPPGGRHLLHLVWRPVERFEDLPPVIRRFIDDEAPLMKSLPDTLETALAEIGLTALPE
jgi:hypothetical protein